MKKWFVLIVALLVFGCESNQATLQVVPNEHNQHYHIETFEPSMVTLLYQDINGDQSHILLSDAHVVGGIPNATGHHVFIVQYEDAELEMFIYLSNEPVISCRYNFNAYDDFTDDSLAYQDTTITKQVPASIGGCPLDVEFEPWTILKHEFSHISPSLDGTISSQELNLFKVYYISDTYMITYYDHQGEVIEVFETRYGQPKPTPDYTFPEYFIFNKWDVETSSVTEDEAIYPIGEYKQYQVTFRNDDNSYLGNTYVKHGEDITHEIYVPPRDGYIHVGWSAPLTNITEEQTIIPLFERILSINDDIEQIYLEKNYTASIYWEGLPVGDGTITHTFEIDNDEIKADVWNTIYYLVEEETKIIAQYEDDPTWVKTVYLGETSAEYLLIDIHALSDNLISFSDNIAFILTSHYETIMVGSHEDVKSIKVDKVDDTIIITIDWEGDMVSTITIYDINKTSVTIPEHITLFNGDK